MSCVQRIKDLWWFPDNPIAQNLLVKQLERHQLNVIATGNGHEALAGKRIASY
jgi:hypothetical protein